LHQVVARAARHHLVRVSAVLCAAETRQLRKVQDVVFLHEPRAQNAVVPASRAPQHFGLPVYVGRGTYKEQEKSQGHGPGLVFL